MLGFCIVAPMGDAVAKLLGQSVPLGQLLFIRFAVQALVLIPLVWATRRLWRMKGRVLRLTILRTLLHIFGIGAMFSALQYLPLADAVAIAFVMPFILLLLGRFVLNEEVGIHRLAACGVGFIGTLLVIQPSFAEVGWPALLPLVVAVDFALFILVTRTIAKDIDPISMQTISGFMAIPMLVAGIAVFAMFFDVETLLVVPDQSQTMLLFAIGALGTIAHLLMTWALRFAPSATLAPMQYLEIPFATVLGYFVFSDLPNGIAALGSIITICSGLYVVYREHAVSRVEAS